MAKQNLFALSEETKDKVIKKINEPGAPDTYTIKPSTMREYYSRVWVVGLDEDLPGITYDEQGVPVTQGVEAWILEKSEQEKIDKRYWKNSNVKLKKLVYNLTEETFIANDSKGKPIPYVAMQDMLGTIWIQPKGGEEPKVATKLTTDDQYPSGATLQNYSNLWLYCDDVDSFATKSEQGVYVYNPLGLPPGRRTILGKVDGFPGEAEEPSSGSRHIGKYVAISCDVREYFRFPGSGYTPLKAGDVVPIIHDGSEWVLDSQGCGARLAVCQKDMPTSGYTESYFYMPYFPLEANYGVPANTESSITSTSDGFIRCGLDDENFSISNDRLDYLYCAGRFVYQPRFLYRGTAEAAGAGVMGYVQVTILGHSIPVFFDVARGRDYLIQPDIYAGDNIVVLVDASSENKTTWRAYGITYPTDYQNITGFAGSFTATGGARGWDRGSEIGNLAIYQWVKNKDNALL